MPSKKQYNLVPNDDGDTRIPLHSDEAFHHGITFQAKVSPDHHGRCLPPSHLPDPALALLPPPSLDPHLSCRRKMSLDSLPGLASSPELGPQCGIIHGRIKSVSTI